jgi:DNA-binding response OmpR family regulator
MLSARKGVNDIKIGLEKDADAYVAKPFNFDTLLGIIQGRLGK